MDQGQGVFHLEAAQVRCHRGAAEQFQIQERVCAGCFCVCFVERLALHSFRAQRRHARVNLTGLRAGDAKFLGDGAVVEDFDDHRSVTALLKNGFRRTAAHVEARLGIQFHDEERLFVQCLLQGGGIVVLAGLSKGTFRFFRQWGAEEIECFHQSRHAGGQWLRGDGNGRFGGGACGNRKCGKQKETSNV